MQGMKEEKGKKKREGNIRKGKKRKKKKNPQQRCLLSFFRTSGRNIIFLININI